MGTVRYTVVNGEILAERRDGVRKRYIPDPLGSTVAMTDANGQITDTWKYWPYGEVRTRTGNTPTRFQFVGTRGYSADSTNRRYVRARVLHAGYGQWGTRDAFGIRRVGGPPRRRRRAFPLLADLRHRQPGGYGSAAGLSLYAYADNHPTTATDPAGRFVPPPGPLPPWLVVYCAMNPATCVAVAAAIGIIMIIGFIIITIRCTVPPDEGPLYPPEDVFSHVHDYVDYPTLEEIEEWCYDNFCNKLLPNTVLFDRCMKDCVDVNLGS